MPVGWRSECLRWKIRGSVSAPRGCRVVAYDLYSRPPGFDGRCIWPTKALCVVEENSLVIVLRRTLRVAPLHTDNLSCQPIQPAPVNYRRGYAPLTCARQVNQELGGRWAFRGTKDE